MIERWLSIPYADYGRDENGADCWGLVRLIRRELFDSDLPSFEQIRPDNKRGLTDAALETIAFCNFKLVSEPRAGSIATVWRGRLCTHVGIAVEIEGRLAVVDTARATGVKWARIDAYERLHGDVRYYDERD